MICGEPAVAKLRKEEIVTLQVLKQKGESNQAIGQRLGVTEGAVRYHLSRARLNAPDGRRKPTLIERFDLGRVVDHWCNSKM